MKEKEIQMQEAFKKTLTEVGFVLVFKSRTHNTWVKYVDGEIETTATIRWYLGPHIELTSKEGWWRGDPWNNSSITYVGKFSNEDWTTLNMLYDIIDS